MNSATERGHHWRDEDLLDRLYGLEPELGSEEHLRSCPQCAMRWQALEARRAELVIRPMLADEILRAQRQAIWARIENHGRVHWTRWAIPSAVAVALAMAALLYEPSSPLPPRPPAEIAELAAAQPVSDKEFFDNIAAVAAKTEPQAAETVQGLFAGGGD